MEYYGDWFYGVVGVLVVIKHKTPLHCVQGRWLIFRRRPTFPGVTPVSSAQVGLTTLFGMGRGGHHYYDRH
jgi:hypothetical protein